jgi:hypothetical protein
MVVRRQMLLEGAQDGLDEAIAPVGDGSPHQEENNPQQPPQQRPARRHKTPRCTCGWTRSLMPSPWARCDNGTGQQESDAGAENVEDSQGVTHRASMVIALRVDASMG